MYYNDNLINPTNKTLTNTFSYINNRYDDIKKDGARATSFFKSVVSLTTYKKDVDNSNKRLIYYGLNHNDLKEVKEKIRKQNLYLEYNYIYDKMSEVKIPLKTLVISANHNPNRYYALIQNRINTLCNEANKNELVPLFLTLTLPSSYPKMKVNKKTKELIRNPKYNYINVKESVKVLTRMFSRLRHDRSLKELSKNERIYYRVNEPHRDGTPHTHILLYVPAYSVSRVIKAFKRLFDHRANDIQSNIRNAAAYIMKYINKTLPMSKQKDLTLKDNFLNAWYSKHRVIRFNSSRTTAPLSLYRLLYRKFSLQHLTTLLKRKALSIYVLIDNRTKVMEVFNGDELVYQRGSNFSLGKGMFDY